MTRFALPASVAILLMLAACTTTMTNDSDGTGGANNPSSASASCVANNNDGASSCQGFESCKGGEYCSISHCNAGCLTTANCPNGQFCDMAAPSNDPFVKKPVGICRACPTRAEADDSNDNTREETTTTTTTTTPTTCRDVHGVYKMSGSSSSSEGCGVVSGECNVTQSGCTVTISCEQAFGSNRVELDSNNKGTLRSSFDVQGMKLTANCAIGFTSTTMAFDCQFTGQGGGATCKSIGTQK